MKRNDYAGISFMALDG